jgi:hypothetical protein
MRRKLFVALLSLLGLLFPESAVGQHLGDVTPTNVAQAVFTGQTTAAVTPNASNIGLPSAICVPTNGSPCGLPQFGQNLHFLTYTTSGTVTELIIRLEGSLDGARFFPIGDDAGDISGTTAIAGAVCATGQYPVVRANLVRIVGGGSVTANYSGTSGTSGCPVGGYNSGLQLRKTVLVNVSAGSNQNAFITAPFGNMQGYILLFPTSPPQTFPAASTVNTVGITGPTVTSSSPSLNVKSGAIVSQVFAVPAGPADLIQVNFVSGGASAVTFSMFYLFVPPGSQQGISANTVEPPSLTVSANLVSSNSEATSVANTAVTTSFAAVSGARVHLWSVSARCSAGTAQLTVKDGVAGTTVWSTAATEVSTTTFRYQWNPALSSAVGNGMDVTLSTCGVANTGTLDVQESQF